MLDQFSRTELLFGKEAMQALARSRVAVFGIGGVGGYVCEALVRSGVGAFGLVDDDRVCLTNLNRQIHATRSTVGKEQAKDLDPDELLAARLVLRPERERAAALRLQAAYGDEFKAVTLYDSKLDVRDMLGERAQRPGKTVDRQQKRGTRHREWER